MYLFGRKRATILDPHVEKEVTDNLASSYNSLAQEIRELKEVQLKAEADRSLIIDELRKLNASLDTLSTKTNK